MVMSRHDSQIAWVGVPTAPAWLPTEMLIKVINFTLIIL